MIFLRDSRTPGVLLKGGFLLLAAMLLSAAGVRAQNETVAFPSRQITLRTAISEIEKQTDYMIVINDALLDNIHTIGLTGTALSLQSALDQMFAGRGLEWMIRNKYIVISKREEKQPTSVAKAPRPVSRTGDVYKPNDRTKVDGLTGPRRDRTAVRYDTVVRPGDAKQYPAAYSAYVPAAKYSDNNHKLPGYALKVNLLYGGAALTPNLSFEFGVGQRSTIELSGSYSWWGRKRDASADHKQFAHYIIRPEYRYWLCERFNGHYFGVHAFYSKYYISSYNVPLLFDKEYSYDGWALGAGVDYGYHWAFARRWGLDFNIGVGYVRMEHKKGTCAKCQKTADWVSADYFGPTRLGVTLVFMIK